MDDNDDVASKLYGFNAAIIDYVFVLHCIFMMDELK